MLQDFKSEIKLFLIVAAVSAVLAVAGILLLKAMQPASPAAGPAPRDQAELDFAGWQTYHNTKYEFEIKHPADWVVEEYDSTTESAANANHVDFSDDTDNNLTYTYRFGFIVYTNPQNIPIRDYLVQERVNILYPLTYDIALPEQERQSTVYALKDTLFRGYTALRNEQNTKLFVAVDTKVIMFYMDSLEESADSFDSPPFKQILSTFRFME